MVVRYFGSTLLGVPGLINAYKNAAALVLQTTPIVKRLIEIRYSLQFDYTVMKEVMQIIKQYNASVIEKEINLFCLMVIGIQRSRSEDTIYHFKQLRSVEFQKL